MELETKIILDSEVGTHHLRDKLKDIPSVSVIAGQDAKNSYIVRCWYSSAYAKTVATFIQKFGGV